jgi:HEAT repeat protein
MYQIRRGSSVQVYGAVWVTFFVITLLGLVWADADLATRRTAVTSLIYIGGQASGNVTVRVAALGALGDLRLQDTSLEGEVVTALVYQLGLSSNIADIKIAAASSLGRFQTQNEPLSQRVTISLQYAANTTSNGIKVRVAAVQGLGSLNSPNATLKASVRTTLNYIAGSSDPELKGSAQTALARGKQVTPIDINALISQASSSDQKTRLRALRALGIVSTEDPAMLRKLVSMLTSKLSSSGLDVETRAASATALGQLLR